MKENDPTKDANWHHVREFWSVFFKTAPHLLFTLIHIESKRKKAIHMPSHRLNSRQRHYMEATQKPAIDTDTALTRGRQRELLKGIRAYAELGFSITRSAARNSLPHRMRKG